MTDDESLLFSADDNSEANLRLEKTPKNEKWKIMVVDDEEEVHNVTRLVLSGLTFHERGIELLSAHSGAEGKKLIAEHPDTALMLLDVVMETDNAGLEVVKYIREELKNRYVRIVLRTGQPGQAPEREVICNYDINDYKEKTELTAQKLYTLMYTSLRSYHDIMIIEKNKRGLEHIIEASKEVFKVHSMKKFATATLQQMVNVLELDEHAIYCACSGFAIPKKEGSDEKDQSEVEILAATGAFQQLVNGKSSKSLPKEILEKILMALKEKKSLFFNDQYIAYFKSESGLEHVLLVSVGDTYAPLTPLDQHLFEVFCSNVAVAFENVYHNEQFEHTQREIVYRLIEAVENGVSVTSSHVKRVAIMTKALALKAGVFEKQAEIMKLASPMHDVGKIAIPEMILNKAGKLSNDEWDIMKKHADLGYDLFKGSENQVLTMAATIAQEHHEKWDGSGYPQGLAGEKIELAARIVAIVDVFDALVSKRRYREAWPMDKVTEFFKTERGKTFDPKLVDIFLENIAEFVAIREKYGDTGGGECCSIAHTD